MAQAAPRVQNDEASMRVGLIDATGVIAGSSKGAADTGSILIWLTQTRISTFSVSEAPVDQADSRRELN